MYHKFDPDFIVQILNDQYDYMLTLTDKFSTIARPNLELIKDADYIDTFMLSNVQYMVEKVWELDIEVVPWKCVVKNIVEEKFYPQYDELSVTYEICDGDWDFSIYLRYSGQNDGSEPTTWFGYEQVYRREVVTYLTKEEMGL